MKCFGFVVIGVLGCLTLAFADHDSFQVKISPQKATAGSIQTLQIQVIPGNQEIQQGGAVRLEFPTAYGETEFLFWSKPQTDFPEGPGYVRAWHQPDSDMPIKIYGISSGIVEFQSGSGTISSGDTIHIEYHGIIQSLARPLKLRLQYKRSANAEWQNIDLIPVIEILPQDATTMICVIPSDLSRGESFDAAIVLLDKFGNRAVGYRERIELKSSSKLDELPQYYTFTEKDSGLRVFKGLKFQDHGFQKISASDGHRQSKSNYTFVSETPPALRRYFGDTHFHTGTGTRNRGFRSIPDVKDVNTTSLTNFKGINLGGDHRGNFTTAPQAYHYAREVMRLDFATATEHDAALFDSLAWEESQKIATEFNRPGKFTTFYGYEWTGSVGHHIVLYDRPGGQVFDHQNYAELPALWQALSKQQQPALTIPHVTWPFKDHSIWLVVDNSYRKIGEIYSLWNNRFLVQPNDEPQRFEIGADNPWSYQYAWKKGHRIGVVGSTDNHLGQPGANNYTIYTHHTGGYAAVLAANNDRENIWEAFQLRRTYATTGTRIYLDFSADGHYPGSVYETNHPPKFNIKAAGTNKLETVELVKFDGDDYQLLHARSPEGETIVFDYTDTEFSQDSFYYLRVTQAEEYPGRPFANTTSEMAWSSPIWINYSESPKK